MTPSDQIRGFIVDSFLFGDGDQLTEETALVETGVVDSTGILEIIGFMESEFKVVVNDDEVIPSNFADLASMSLYLNTKLGSPDVVLCGQG